MAPSGPVAQRALLPDLVLQAVDPFRASTFALARPEPCPDTDSSQTLASAAVFPLMVWTGALVNDPNIMERNCCPSPRHLAPPLRGLPLSLTPSRLADFALSVVQIILAVGTGVILARFPGFIKRNVDQGCKPEVILRLWTFRASLPFRLPRRAR